MKAASTSDQTSQDNATRISDSSSPGNQKNNMYAMKNIFDYL